MKQYASAWGNGSKPATELELDGEPVALQVVRAGERA